VQYLKMPSATHQPSIPGFRDKSVLITGGASGIGAAIARSLAIQGARVIIGDITVDVATKLVADLRQTTGNSELHALHLDVTDFASQQRFFRDAAAICGPNGINTVVVNAGVNQVPEQLAFLDPQNDYTTGPTDREPPRMKTLEVNFIGAIWTAQLAVAYLTKSSRPKADRHILFVASIAGLFAAPMSPYYSAGKFD
jgi:NAD(P)-dependent dehydrogenase (short-subunit alcohol dehydrogenase family)